MSERGSVGTSERDQLSEIIFMFLGFTLAIGAHSISKEVAGFSTLWFPRGKYLCSLSLVIDCCAFYSLSKDPKIILLK